MLQKMQKNVRHILQKNVKIEGHTQKCEGRKSAKMLWMIKNWMRHTLAGAYTQKKHKKMRGVIIR